MILEFFLSAVLSLSNYPKGKITQINIFLGLSLDDTPKMGDDSVVACFGTKVVNYWNTDFASIPIEVSELMHTVVSNKIRKTQNEHLNIAFQNLISRHEVVNLKPF